MVLPSSSRLVEVSGNLQSILPIGTRLGSSSVVDVNRFLGSKGILRPSTDAVRDVNLSFLPSGAMKPTKVVATDALPEKFTYTLHLTIPGLGTFKQREIEILKSGDLFSLLDFGNSVPGEATQGGALLTLDSLVKTQGFHAVVSQEEPEDKFYKTADGQIFPVLWSRPTTTMLSVIPQEPLFDSVKFTVSVPSYTGIRYAITSFSKDGNTNSTDVEVSDTVDLRKVLGISEPFQVTVSALPLPGYATPDVFSWSHNFVGSSSMSLLASSGFEVDSDVREPVPLDYAFGGSRPELHLSLFKSSITYRDTHFVQKNGHLVVPTPSEYSEYQIEKKDNAWVGLALDGVENVRVEIFVSALGSGTGDIFSLGVRGNPRDPVGLYIDFNVGRDRVSQRNSGFVVPALVGLWTLEYIQGVLTVKLPSGESFSRDDVSPTGFNVWLRSYGNDGGFSIDFLKVYGIF